MENGAAVGAQAEPTGVAAVIDIISVACVMWIYKLYIDCSGYVYLIRDRKCIVQTNITSTNDILYWA